ncbi:MAG: hypothetical protein ABI905_05760 [Betaproteobacteria bacterium]
MKTTGEKPSGNLPDAREKPRQAPDRHPDGGDQGGNVSPGPRPHSLGDDDQDPFPPKDTDPIPRRDPHSR